MTMTTIYRDANGKLINIGEWDDCIVEDDNGMLYAANPLPAGATQHTADVVVGWDGGLYLTDDPRRLGALDA